MLDNSGVEKRGKSGIDVDKDTPEVVPVGDMVDRRCL